MHRTTLTTISAAVLLAVLFAGVVAFVATAQRGPVAPPAWEMEPDWFTAPDDNAPMPDPTEAADAPRLAPQPNR